ncbi:hypothetical protein SAMN02745975_00725 [Geosporobacter subterraneus DSM 17957]|uniref:Uncharacterized protein n=1 Tax=Geosporobacter subterraneus DSM 17957 TaxID=1121919 RepID=A0A1M6EEY7_9FIRM|nr:hypothetical protein SAMN02745975_00725 [Geosporobacter subterraneus DSM 17957]
MSINTLSIENDLRLLCIQMIDLLTKMKENGIISEDEYQEHIRLKRMFIQDHFGMYV